MEKLLTNSLRRFGESPQHFKQKERIGRILKTQGWAVWIDSFQFKCQTEKGARTYTPDIFAETPRGQRVVLEIQGSRGKGDHSTKIHRGKDRNRRLDIQQAAGRSIRFVEFWITRKLGPLDVRTWSEDDIISHINESIENDG